MGGAGEHRQPWGPRYKHLNAEFQRIARRDKKAFLRDQCKEIDPDPSSKATLRVKAKHEGALPPPCMQAGRETPWGVG